MRYFMSYAHSTGVGNMVIEVNMPIEKVTDLSVFGELGKQIEAMDGGKVKDVVILNWIRLED